jgi:hypothetical protein
MAPPHCRGFVFHFKAMGIFCTQAVPIGTLPHALDATLASCAPELLDRRQTAAATNGARACGRGQLAHARTHALPLHVSGLACSLAGLPARSLTHPPAHTAKVSLSDLPEPARARLWEVYNSALRPAAAREALGAVMFQFPLAFEPSDANRRHVVRAVCSCVPAALAPLDGPHAAAARSCTAGRC